MGNQPAKWQYGAALDSLRTTHGPRRQRCTRLRRRLISWGGTVLTNALLGTRMRDMTSGFECFARAALASRSSPGASERATTAFAATRPWWPRASSRRRSSSPCGSGTPSACSGRRERSRRAPRPGKHDALSTRGRVLIAAGLVASCAARAGIEVAVELSERDVDAHLVSARVSYLDESARPGARRGDAHAPPRVVRRGVCPGDRARRQLRLPPVGRRPDLVVARPPRCGPVDQDRLAGGIVRHPPDDPGQRRRLGTARRRFRSGASPVPPGGASPACLEHRPGGPPLSRLHRLDAGGTGRAELRVRLDRQRFRRRPLGPAPVARRGRGVGRGDALCALHGAGTVVHVVVLAGREGRRIPSTRAPRDERSALPSRHPRSSAGGPALPGLRPPRHPRSIRRISRGCPLSPEEARHPLGASCSRSRPGRPRWPCGCPVDS